jgi:hypothetical protein
MTNPKNPTTAADDQEEQAPREAPAEARELDAEIVRDLEIGEQAGDVRGGICASSHVGVACQPK